ncbi:MAG: preprotein translocase subunit YajC [Phycisphaerales bacterium]
MDITNSMSEWSTNWSSSTLIAQDSGVLGAPSGGGSTTGSQPLGTTGDIGAPGGASPAPSSNLFFIMILMMAGILILTAFSGRKERKKHASLLSSLGKKDKVRAAGGIIGTIIEIKNDEVLLETDKASNTRIRVARSSISTVISSKSTPAADETKDGSQDESSKMVEANA